MTKKAKIFIISAPSGCGKTTLCNKLLKDAPCFLKRSVSYTTRLPRPGERNGADYIFVSKEKFNTLLRKRKFIEHASVFGNLYGTPIGPLRQTLRQNRSVLLSIDVQGAMQMKKLFDRQSVLIFILPPSFGELKKRQIKRRADAKTEMAKRLKLAKHELSYLPEYDYAVVNKKLKNALFNLKAIIVAEQNRIN